MGLSGGPADILARCQLIRDEEPVPPWDAVPRRSRPDCPRCCGSGMETEPGAELRELRRRAGKSLGKVAKVS